jgi:hypothetical protein
VPSIVAKKGISDNLGSFLLCFIYDYSVDPVGRCGATCHCERSEAISFCAMMTISLR